MFGRSSQLVDPACLAGWIARFGPCTAIGVGAFWLGAWIAGAAAGWSVFLGIALILLFWRSSRRLREYSRALQASEATLLLAQRCAGAGVWDVDLVGNRVVWQEPWYELYGVPRSLQSSLENWIASIHPEDRGRVDSEFRQAVLGRGVHRIEFRIVREGEVRWLHSEGRVMCNDQGEPVRVTGITWDITDRKETEEALRRNEEKLRMHMQRMPIGYIVFDAENCFQQVNPAAEAIFGYAEAELLGRHANLIVPEPERERVHEIMSRLSEGDMTAHSINDNVTKDGRLIVCEWTNTPLRDRSGGHIGFLSMVQDITGRRQTEQQLTASLKQLREAQQGLMRQERLATLGKLAGSVAHEMRTPLSVIRNTAVYLKHVLRESTGEIKESLAELDRAVISCNHIISEMLDFVREAREETSVVCVGTAFGDALRSLTVPASVRIVGLEPAVLNHELRANLDQVTRILINLFQNAFQAMRDGGELEISVATVPDGNVRITVRDTGSGIPPEHLDKVFEPLFSTKIRGIGLGLAIAQRYARVNGGDLTVESTLGEGTSFHLLLPGV